MGTFLEEKDGGRHTLGQRISLGCGKLLYCSVVLLFWRHWWYFQTPSSLDSTSISLSLPPSLNSPSVSVSHPHFSLPPSTHPLSFSPSLISPSLPPSLCLVGSQMSSRQGVESSLRQLEMERALLQHQNTESLRKADTEMERKRILENEREPLPLWWLVCFYMCVIMGFWAFLPAVRRDGERGVESEFFGTTIPTTTT